MYQQSPPSTALQLGTRSPHRPHVYRNLFLGTWICDQQGTRANPGPDTARTVHRTHSDAVRAATGLIPAPRLGVRPEDRACS
ncbi:hypothetical protein SAMN02982929_01390 [Saccharopolyspora kobensis]|uniref:Uncharacterized protein n=1 Tax=Saccharopolyspora kobensis TaxID=146035 RepID=A0A1H5X3I5_9PSEU|nr:hypothetical protein [Saccharopolyspora kobensis]SEG06308.1 hypothetical protein SAMN02982929_01390 [Saccharopolyspora kobensis]SFD82239.1 hypothetical protein SAMN05216506_106367 [Saccharopolyspora kobensis]